MTNDRRSKSAPGAAPGLVAERTSAGTGRGRRVGRPLQAMEDPAAAGGRLTADRERERPEAAARVAEPGLREAQESFESAFDNAPIGMALVTMDGRWLQVNDALCRITGRTAEELRATTLRAITNADDVDLDARSHERLLAGQIPSYQVEQRYRHAWGHDVWVLVTRSIVRDAHQEPLYTLTQVQDISERKEMARHLEYVVDHDFLTGLHNRRHFEKALERETQRTARYGSPGAMLLIDLDHFKEVNDTFGHRTGDELLKGVAGLLTQRLRHTDVVARLGGDEFAALLTHTDAAQAQSLADEVVEALGRETAVLADQSIRITASVGVVMLDGLTDVEVLAYADLAMYDAKEAGRNRFAVHRPVKEACGRVSTRLLEAEQIRHALEEDRLILFCQPLLDLRRGAICQFELLLRLPDEQTGVPLPPSVFLYSAERSGLIQAIDGWVVRKAIGLIAEHARRGLELVLGVNVSGRSIGDRKLAALIEDALADSGIDPARLVLELTETAVLSGVEDARAFATRLHGRGCQVAVDDFGAGFRSFYYLNRFPFDTIKIDGEFIRGLVTNTMNQLVVSAIVKIAQGMGKKTVAESVEDEETVTLLRELGVDLAQGYHIGRPGPVSEVLMTPVALPGTGPLTLAGPAMT